MNIDQVEHSLACENRIESIPYEKGEKPHNIISFCTKWIKILLCSFLGTPMAYAWLAKRRFDNMKPSFAKHAKFHGICHVYSSLPVQSMIAKALVVLNPSTSTSLPLHVRLTMKKRRKYVKNSLDPLLKTTLEAMLCLISLIVALLVHIVPVTLLLILTSN